MRGRFTKFFLLVAILLFAVPAAAQPIGTNPIGQCFQFMPGLGGKFCIEDGAVSFWVNLSGDLTNYTGVLCSGTNTTKCGYVTVNGVNGEKWNISGISPANGNCAVWNSTRADWEPGACGGGTPGGTSGELQYNNAGAFGGVPAVNGDGTLNTATGALSVNTVEGGKTPVVTSGTNTAAGTSGTDNLANFNVNGVLNAADFGAVCSNTTESATTTASNATVAVGAIGDFKVGQYVSIPKAGASNTLSTPTINSVARNGYHLNGLPTIPNISAPQSPFDACETDTLGLPTSNASCSTEYCYTIQSIGQTGIGTGLNGMRSAQSAAVCSSANGPATLSVSTNEIVAYTLDANTVGTVIRGCHSTTSCTPTAIVAVKPGWNVFGASTTYYVDMGNHYGVDATGGTGATAADLDAQITAISGLNVTLSVAPAQSGSFTMHHDVSPNLQAGVNASCQTGSTNCAPTFIPACDVPYQLSQAVSLWGLAGAGFTAHTSSLQPSGQPVQIQWNGPIGGIVFNDNYASYPEIQGIGLDGATGNSVGTLVDGNRYGTFTDASTQGPGAPASSASQGSTPTNSRIEDVDCGQNVGLCFDLSGDGTANLENQRYIHDSCDQGNEGNSGWACFYSNSQETYNEVIEGSSVSGRDFAFDFPRSGSFQILNSNIEGNVVAFFIVQISDSGLISGGQAEGPQFFEYVNTATGHLKTANWRVDTLGTPDGHVAAYQGYNEVDNIDFAPGNGTANNIALSNNNSAATFINDAFGYPLNNPYGGGNYPAQPYGLPFDDGGGGNIQSLYTVINNIVNITLNNPAVIARSAHDGVSQPIGFDFIGTPSASAKLAIPCSTALTIPTNFAGPTTTAKCLTTNPSENDAYTLKINGSSVGTLTLSTGCVLTLGTATATTCTAGQVMELDAPATVSGKDIVFSVQATL